MLAVYRIQECRQPVASVSALGFRERMPRRFGLGVLPALWKSRIHESGTRNARVRPWWRHTKSKNKENVTLAYDDAGRAQNSTMQATQCSSSRLHAVRRIEESAKRNARVRRELANSKDRALDIKDIVCPLLDRLLSRQTARKLDL